MIWLTWRQFRTQTLITGVLLAAAVTGLVISGLGLHHTYTHDLARCGQVHDCPDTLSALQHRYRTAFDLLELLVVAVPGLIGIFWGAPLISREFETGTHQLVWNQSITRTRWLTVKLTGVAAVSIATGAILSWLLTWWAGPLDHITGSRFAAMTFASRDMTPIAYACFAFTLGAAAGLLIRRMLPAMAVTLAVFVGLQVLVPTLVRPHLLSSTTVRYPVNASIAAHAHGVYTTDGGGQWYFLLTTPSGAWVTSAPPIEDAADHVAHPSHGLSCLLPTDIPSVGKPAPPPPRQIATCLASYDLHESITYQPANHYWPLQWAETAIYLLLAALLTLTCFIAIRRRRS